ncbi:MAG: hypothetical protein LLG20_18640 [Acidobacteriales bacterium]|nr:hypothetical protein [Terriglobales bacterium]
MTDYTKLSDRELDAKCEEFMVPGSKAWYCADTEEWQLRRCSPWRVIPRYSHDLNRARELEDELMRRDAAEKNPFERRLVECYETRLLNLASHINSGTGTFEYFPAIRATARQRAEAFCAVMDAAQPIWRAGDRIIYCDDEPPYAEHAATITEVRRAAGWYEVQPDDVPDDTPDIHESLIVRRAD